MHSSGKIPSGWNIVKKEYAIDLIGEIGKRMEPKIGKDLRIRAI
jgi:hypothetical protein